MVSLNLHALSRRLDRLDDGQPETRPVVLVEFVGGAPGELVGANCRDRHYSRAPGESEEAFTRRIIDDQQPSPNNCTVIFLHRQMRPAPGPHPVNGAIPG